MNLRTTYLTLITLLIFIFSPSCKYSDHFKTYTYFDEWEINYPSYMRKSTHVYPGSEFQAANGYRDTYVFMREIISKLQTESIKDSLTEELLANLKDSRLSSDSTYSLNGTEFQTREITGLLNDRRMYYLTSVVISKEQRFHFSSWMFNEKRELWEKDYSAMLHSFHRIQD